VDGGDAAIHNPNYYLLVIGKPWFSLLVKTMDILWSPEKNRPVCCKITCTPMLAGRRVLHHLALFGLLHGTPEWLDVFLEARYGQDSIDAGGRP
jgi:hypothetical protein